MEYLFMPDVKIVSSDFIQNFICAFQVRKNNQISDWKTILISKSRYSNELLEEGKNFYLKLGYSIK